ncbi:MAG: hypothetical protein A2Y79_05880 [Deltaproteobacteria bacterium RBG_13_43_22]|nr:MAG: hypothetical protein A2Y79_05880 [Deltaproteobacteria bacterium RBG_13_43_22]
MVSSGERFDFFLILSTNTGKKSTLFFKKNWGGRRFQPNGKYKRLKSETLKSIILFHEKLIWVFYHSRKRKNYALVSPLRQGNRSG